MAGELKHKFYMTYHTHYTHHQCSILHHFQQDKTSICVFYGKLLHTSNQKKEKWKHSVANSMFLKGKKIVSFLRKKLKEFFCHISVEFLVWTMFVKFLWFG